MMTRLVLLSVVMGLPTPAPAASYSWEFRNGHFDNLSLVPVGAGAVNLLEPTVDGLRISAPAGHEVKSVGFAPRFKIRGNFEISVEFTLLNRSQPETGFGSGPALYLSMGSTQDAAASLGRQLRPDGRDVYGVFAARVDEGQRLPTAKLFDVPGAAASRTGRLHLKRNGDEIAYSVADDLHSLPRLLVTLPVSDADVALLRVGLMQSDPLSSAAIILHRVDIKADELPHLPAEKSRTAQLYRPRYQPPPAPTSYRWLWQSIAGLVLTGSLAGWLWWRRG